MVHGRTCGKRIRDCFKAMLQRSGSTVRINAKKVKADEERAEERKRRGLPMEFYCKSFYIGLKKVRFGILEAGGGAYGKSLNLERKRDIHMGSISRGKLPYQNGQTKGGQCMVFPVSPELKNFIGLVNTRYIATLFLVRQEVHLFVQLLFRDTIGDLPVLGNAKRHNQWKGLFGRLDGRGNFPTSITDQHKPNGQGWGCASTLSRIGYLPSANVLDLKDSQTNYIFAGNIQTPTQGKLGMLFLLLGRMLWGGNSGKQ
ncbi:DNA (cytosine-5)-methyltransferase 1B, partial [Cucurbita argyrosperma subsp. sororia]